MITKIARRHGCIRSRDRRLGREVAVKEYSCSPATSRAASARGADHGAAASVDRLRARGRQVAVGRAVLAMHGHRPLAQRRDRRRQTYAQRIALLPNVLATPTRWRTPTASKVIHRDLKPRNVAGGRVRRDRRDRLGHREGSAQRRARLADAGTPPSARPPIRSRRPPRRPTARRRSARCCTPAYMPPEQTEGEPVDERADVYAIGAMLYHVISGRRRSPRTRRPSCSRLSRSTRRRRCARSCPRSRAS